VRGGGEDGDIEPSAVSPRLGPVAEELKRRGFDVSDIEDGEHGRMFTVLVHPVVNELWPRLDDHEYRWELYKYGLAEGADKIIVSDIIELLVEVCGSNPLCFAPFALRDFDSASGERFVSRGPECRILQHHVVESIPRQDRRVCGSCDLGALATGP
jgi:hypothetical protein